MLRGVFEEISLSSCMVLRVSMGQNTLLTTVIVKNRVFIVWVEVGISVNHLLCLKLPSLYWCVCDRIGVLSVIGIVFGLAIEADVVHVIFVSLFT